jgi:outer membrane protein insertion porin family
LFLTSSLQSQKLNSFVIDGNKEFDDDTYFKWSKLSLNQNYFEGIIDSVKNRISTNLLSNGFYFFDFNRAEVLTPNDSTKFNIKIIISEDSPTLVNKINIQTDDSTLLNKYYEPFRFLEGQVFNKNDIEKIIDEILIDFENTGFPFAKIKINSVQLLNDSSEGKRFADINLKLESGSISKIDKIDITGNTSTKDYVIVRELRLDDTEPYNQKKIEEFPKRLNRLRFFEPVPVPQFYINSKNEGVLVLNVKEKNTNNFDGIIGYIPPGKNESSGYVTGLVNISLRNLFGTGRGVSLKWNKYDRNSQELDLRYLEPWLLNFPVNINAGLYQRIQDSTYVQRRIEGSIDYLATENISAGLVISTESVVPTVRTIPVFTIFNSSYLTTGANLKIDTRDDPYSPTEGLMFINTYSYTRKKINGPAEYITATTNTSVDLQRFAVSFYFFYELFSKQVIAVGVNGKELRTSSFENSDLFRLGGTNTLRGYREDQFLGSRIFWSNLEYRALFTRRSYGFLFFDTGYYLRPEQADKNISKQEDFLYGFGLGLNIETGLGVLRVSYALGKDDSFSDGKIHFGILNEF